MTKTETYNDSRRLLDALLGGSKSDRLATLRELELRFMELAPLKPALLMTAKRRRQELARADFPHKLEALRGWLRSDAAFPDEAYQSLLTDLHQLLDEAEGHNVRDRQESTITEERQTK
jgi:hypothetical protein